MNSKGPLDRVVSSTLNPNSEDAVEFDVPKGETWRVLEVGTTDVGPPGSPGSSTSFDVSTDGGASWDVMRVLAASNGTSSLGPLRDVAGGDNVKIRIVRRSSAGQREVTSWFAGIVFEG